MRIPSHYERSHDELEMTPLIDVVFLLMIFFVCTAGFQIAEEILPSNILAAGGTASPLEDPLEMPLEQIVVRTRIEDGQPAWTINERNYTTLADVEQVLRSVFDVEPTLPVILHNWADVPLGEVIRLYDLCRVVGFEKVQFAASLRPDAE